MEPSSSHFFFHAQRGALDIVADGSGGKNKQLRGACTLTYFAARLPPPQRMPAARSSSGYRELAAVGR